MVIFLNAVLGLLLNLKYPKLDSNSDAEVIKQSMSTTIAVFVGLGLFFVSLILITILNHLLGFTLAVTIHILVLIIIGFLIISFIVKDLLLSFIISILSLYSSLSYSFDFIFSINCLFDKFCLMHKLI